MNEVQCSGFEKSLTECHFNREALGCSHEEDAAVKCNIPDMGFNNRVSSLFYTGQIKSLSRLEKKGGSYICLSSCRSG